MDLHITQNHTKLSGKFCLLWVGFNILIGCAAQRTPLTPSLELVDIPPVGSIHQSELGDTLLSKGRIYFHDGIELHNRIEAGDGFLIKKWIMEPQRLIAKQIDNAWTYYYGETFQVYDAVVGTVLGVGGLRVSLADKNDVEMFSSTGLTGLKPNPRADIMFTKITAADRPSFSQELIYNGRIGANVRFLYREFSNSLIRGAFSQEVQYDLNDGTSIGFKGARIEIIEATNTYIRYKVLNNFPGPQ